MEARTSTSALSWSEATTLFGLGCVYGLTVSKHVLGGDNGEFVTLMRTGGAAHPPGYPLYVLLLHAMRWLPADSVAHAASMVTAMMGLGAVFCLQRAIRAWGGGYGAATLGGVLFGAATVPWQLFTHAEVFALHALVAGAIAWIAGPLAPLRGPRRLFVLGLLGGLALSNHLSIVALAPLGLYGLHRGCREAHGPRALVGTCAGLVLGLLPYVWMLLRARFALWSWGAIVDVRSLLSHVLRSDYGTFQLAVGVNALDPLTQVRAWLLATTIDTLAMPWLLLATLALPSGKRPWRALGFIGAALLLAGPVFVSFFNIRPEGLGASVVARFYVLPELLAVLLGAIAADRWLRKLHGATLAFVASACLLLLILAGLPRVREHHADAVERYVHNALVVAAPRAILVGTGDHRMGGFLHARYVLNDRPDVTFVNARLLLVDWYRQRVSQELHVTLPEPVLSGAQRSLDGAAVLRALLSTGRPLQLTDVPSKSMATLPSYPIGPLIQLLAPGTPLPTASEVGERNERVLEQMQLPNPIPRAGTWGGDLQADYARPWFALAHIYASTDPSLADTLRRRGEALRPR